MIEANQELAIGGVTYRVAEHPHAPGMPYGQEGRQATVYQLLSESGSKALKVFKSKYRAPSLVSLSERLRPFSSLAGLSVCDRQILSPFTCPDLLKEHPDLAYAVLMPWVEGPTWMEMVLGRRDLSREQCLGLAKGLAGILARMEERGIAHCDLSAPNVILSSLSPSYSSGQQPISLVDVEQLYGPGLDRPSALPGGSPGYAHPSAREGLWQPDADRFAGAVLLAEMLGWSDERVRSAAWGESYFEPGEEGRDWERASLLAAALKERWGEKLSSFFNRAWSSASLSECPTFGEWLLALPEQSGPKQAGTADAGMLLYRAAKLEAAGDLIGARATYQEALSLLSEGQSLHEEVRLILERLDRAVSEQREAMAKAERAGELEAEGRWKEASLIYEALLESKSGGEPERATWQEGLSRTKEEAELAELFESAAKLKTQGDSRAARELSLEVLRKRPNYQRKGVSAAALLDGLGEDANHKAQVNRSRTARPSWLLPVAVMGMALLLLGAGSLFQAQYQASSQAGTATTQAAVAAAQAESTRTAEAAAARSAAAAAERTATASALGTAQAGSIAEAAVVAANQAATGTATTQALRATTEAAQATTQALATAQAQATMAAQSSSQAQQTAAAVAIGTARAMAAQQGTKVAQATSTNVTVSATPITAAGLSESFDQLPIWLQRQCVPDDALRSGFTDPLPCGVVGGELFQRTVQANRLSVILPGQYADFSVEVKSRVVLGGGNWGLDIYSQGYERLFALDSAREYAIGDSGLGFSRTSWTGSPVVHAVDTLNQFRIVVKSQTAAFFVNGQQLAQVQLQPSASGWQVRLFAMATLPTPIGMEVHWDDLTIVPGSGFN